MNPDLPHPPLFFDGWYNVSRAALLALLGFVALMILLRLSGKRTLSKLTAFDFVFIVAVGELLAHTILSKEVTLAECIAAILTMIVFQLVVGKIAQRWETAEKFINGEPTLLFAHGKFLPRALRKERITESEVRAAIRLQGGHQGRGRESRHTGNGRTAFSCVGEQRTRLEQPRRCGRYRGR